MEETSFQKPNGRGYGNLFLQIFQLKNFVRYLTLALAFLLLYVDNKNWFRAKPFFVTWLISTTLWLVLLLVIYRGELENRIFVYLISLMIRILPILLICLALYLILIPFELKSGLGVLILLFALPAIYKKNNKLVEEQNKKILSNTPRKSIRARMFKLRHWSATETNNDQGADYRELDLKGKPLKGLELTMNPSAKYWRAGFKISSPNGTILPLRSQESLLFHLGSADSEKQFGITAYINGNRIPTINKVITFDKNKPLSIRLEINNKNFLKCFVNDIVEYEHQERIDPQISKKAFVVAWGDGQPYRVEFENIKYVLRE